MYFEKIGKLQLIESTWKIVIKTDVISISHRWHALQEYIQRAEEYCKKTTGSTNRMCQNTLTILRKENAKGMATMIRLMSMYEHPRSKRGLINAIGTIGKTLFGTMDSEDASRIEEQMKMLQNNQRINNHVIKNQLKIINGTIGHLKSLEQTLNYNENLLAKIANQIRQKQADTLLREEINEYLTLINAIIMDLTNDMEDIIEYLTHTRDATIMTHLLPVDQIIQELDEATLQLAKEKHFPFKVELGNWRTIVKYVKTSAYFNSPFVYTILKFPMITQPEYDIVNVIPLPVHEHGNVFTIAKITHPTLGIDKANRHYLVLKEHELSTCVQERETYTCDQGQPIYHVQENAPCEVQTYIEITDKKCETRHLVTNETIWIALTEPRAWIFSTAKEQEITLTCTDQQEEKHTLNRSGKITVNAGCSLTSRFVILRAPEQEITHQIVAHVPGYNLSRLREEDKRRLKPVSVPQLQKVIKDSNELTALSQSLDEITSQTNNTNFIETIAYPMGSATLISIVIISIVIIIVIVNKRRKTKFISNPIYEGPIQP